MKLGEVLATTSDARKRNAEAVLRSVIVRVNPTRQELSAMSELSKATVSRVVRDLIDANILAEDESTSADRRSLNNPIRLNADLGHVCGVDIGGTNTRIILCDLRGSMKKFWTGSTPAEDTGQELALWLCDRIGALLDDGDEHLLATVVGVPGAIDPSDNSISVSPNLPNARGRAFGSELRARLEGALEILNDADIAAVGERYAGVARDVATSVTFTVGTGLGAGVILDGQLLRGSKGLVGEFGLIPMGSGDLTLEDYLSARGIVRQAGERGLAVATSEEAFAARGPNFNLLRQSIADAMYFASLVSTTAYEANVIIFGGAVASSLADLAPEVQRRLSVFADAAPRIAISTLGTNGGSLGALALALKRAYADLGADDHSSLDDAIVRELTALNEVLQATTSSTSEPEITRPDITNKFSRPATEVNH